jgi:predicted MPP superfamily phosphohydrolase
MQRLLFFTILFFIVLAVDFYVFQGFKLLTKKWLPSFTTWANVLYWAIPIGLFIAIILLNRSSENGVRNPASMWLSTALIGIVITKFVWLGFVLLDDVVRLGKLTTNAIKGNDVNGISRSEFIVTSGFLVAGSLFGGLIYGIAKGAHRYRVLKRKVTIKGLPKAFNGFKIAQISDVHAGSFWDKEAVKKGIDLIMEQAPDAIFFTGDLVNNKAEEFDEYQPIFGKLKAPSGIYSVLGNHDYGDYVQWPDTNGVTKEQNLEKLKSHHQSMGWNLLLNDSKVVEKEGEKLAILGVENWSAHRRFPKYGNLEKAYASAPKGATKLLLSHDPSHWRAEVLKKFNDIAIQFAGHTHGMQFGIDSKYYRWSPVKYQYKEWVDLYKEGENHLYVNRGFGYLGYPGRLGFYPEITLVELQSA